MIGAEKVFIFMGIFFLLLCRVVRTIQRKSKPDVAPHSKAASRGELQDPSCTSTGHNRSLECLVGFAAANPSPAIIVAGDN